MSEEVSEEIESSVTVNPGCGCPHEDGCEMADACDGSMQTASVNGNSVEMRDRVEELQAKNSTLEQDKARASFVFIGGDGDDGDGVDGDNHDKYGKSY